MTSMKECISITRTQRKNTFMTISSEKKTFDINFQHKKEEIVGIWKNYSTNVILHLRFKDYFKWAQFVMGQVEFKENLIHFLLYIKFYKLAYKYCGDYFPIIKILTRLSKDLGFGDEKLENSRIIQRISW